MPPRSPLNRCPFINLLVSPPLCQCVEEVEHISQEGGEEGQGEDEDLPLPELQHNLSLVVQMSRAEVENLEKKLKYQQESVQAHEDAAQKHYAESDSHKRSAQSIRSMVSKVHSRWLATFSMHHLTFLSYVSADATSRECIVDRQLD